MKLAFKFVTHYCHFSINKQIEVFMTAEMTAVHAQPSRATAVRFWRMKKKSGMQSLDYHSSKETH